MRKIIFATALSFLCLFSAAQNVGIGTTTPIARLHVADSNVVFTGPVTIPATTIYNPPVQGPGSRMMWYPQKGAFRVGTVDGTQWDKNNIGLYSFASGYNTTASGQNSTVLGEGSIASGNWSFATGAFTIASANFSTAMGQSSTASAPFSTSIGGSCLASGSGSVAMGYNSKARSFGEIALGIYNTDYIAGSYYSSVLTDRLLVIGNGTSQDDKSDALVILKNGNVGIGTSTPNYKLHLGSSNNSFRIEGPALSGGVALSIGGHGDLQIDKPNLAGGRFIIKDNGNIGIGTTTPTQLLDVNGTIKTNDIQITNGAGVNKILQSDAIGIATWVNTPTPAHTIGESYGGGIVFYTYDNGQHGLIASPADQSTGIGINWSNGAYRYTGSTGDGLNAGAMNTSMIVATQMADNQTGNFAAKLCADYSVTVGGITYGDWYLPSKYELSLLFLQKSVLSGISIDSYWSSSELNNSSAWFQNSSMDLPSTLAKGDPLLVRAVRSF